MIGRRLSGWSALRSVAAASLATVMVGGCLASPTPTPPFTPIPSTAGRATPSPSAGGATPSPSSSASPLDPTAVRGLLVLTSTAETSHLKLFDHGGVTRAVPLPDPGVLGISTDLAGHILATTLDGRAFLSGQVAPDGATTWHRLQLTGVPLGQLVGPIMAGALSPDGRQVAFIAADVSAGQPVDLLVADTSTGAGRVVRIERGFGRPALAWSGRTLIVLTRGTDDEVGSTIVDSATGSVTEGPGPGRPAPSAGTPAWRDEIAALVTSADGRTVAVVSRRTGRIEVTKAGAWLSWDGAGGVAVPLAPATAGISPEIVWTLALSPAGDRLVLVRTDATSRPIALTIRAQAAGWAEVAHIPLAPGVDHVALAWLP